MSVQEWKCQELSDLYLHNITYITLNFIPT